MKKLLSFFAAILLAIMAVSYAQVIPTGTSGTGTGGGGSGGNNTSCTTCECLGTCPDECSSPNPPCYCTDNCGLLDRCDVANPPCDCTGTCGMCLGNDASPLCEPACGTSHWSCTSGVPSGQVTPISPNRAYTWSCTSELSGYSIACRETLGNTCTNNVYTAQPESFADVCTFGGFISTGATLQTVNGIQTNYFMGYCPDTPQYHACRYSIGNSIRVNASNGSDSQNVNEKGAATFTVVVHNIYAEPLSNVSISGPVVSDCSLTPSGAALRYAGGATANFDPDESFSYTCRVLSVSSTTFANDRFVLSLSGKGVLSGQSKNATDPTTVKVPSSTTKNNTITDPVTKSEATTTPVGNVAQNATSGTQGGSTTSGTGAFRDTTVTETSTTSGSSTISHSNNTDNSKGDNGFGSVSSGSTTSNSNTSSSTASGTSDVTGASSAGVSVNVPTINTVDTIVPPLITFSDIEGELFYDENKDGIVNPGEGISNAQVEISKNGSTTKWYNTTDLNGDFSIKRIADGDYDLRISGTTEVFFPEVIPIVIEGGDFSGTFSGFKKSDIDKNPEIVNIFNLKLPEAIMHGGSGNLVIGDLFDPISTLNPTDTISGPTIDNPYYGVTGLETLVREENIYDSNEGNVCGNGIVDSGEKCDDQDKNGQPGYCSSNCLFSAEVVPVVNNDTDLNSNILSNPSQSPEKTGIIQTIKNTASNVKTSIVTTADRVFQQVASAGVIRQSVQLLDATVGIENIKAGVKATVKVAKVVAQEAVVVAQYSVVGVSSLLGAAAVGSNIMVFKAHWMKYTVQEGDTLESISDKFTMTTRKIGKKNSLLGKSGKLQPGMRITVRNRHFMEKDYLDQLKFVLKDVLEKRHLGKIGKAGTTTEKATGIDAALDTAFDFARKYISPAFDTIYRLVRKIV